MYGPPRVCKGIVEGRWTVCGNVSGLISEAVFPGAKMEIRTSRSS
jgi:predicted PP-loop superfamily ATPase